ncbi:MAG: M48 family metalloprotease [Syntrophobacterales bacterium]|jgi:predicted Zn-dependent protease
MVKRHLKMFLVGSLILLVFFWTASCALDPVTGKPELMLLSESQEIELGRQTDAQVVREYGIYEDRELTVYVNNLCQQVAKVSHRPNLPYECKVVDSQVINAFAVPGGYIYFTRGIMAHLNNEAELLGVMGHELGHVTARHSAEQISRAQLAQVGLGLTFGLSETLASFSDVIQLGVGMMFLKFSRDNERESDDLGVEYSSKLGYDATQMANFFQTLDRMQPSSDRSGLPEWFSTHPNPADRDKTVRRKAKEWQANLGLRDPKVNRNPYLRRIDGLVFGEDPRQGFIENNIFYHPGLRFSFAIPAGWDLQNTRVLVQMISPKKDAIILFTLASASSPEEGAQRFVKESGAGVVESGPVTVNNLPAYRLVSQLRSRQGLIYLLSYFIQKESRVYVFHGLTSANLFKGYYPTLEETMQQFKELTDPSKLNVKPARIRIRSAPKSGSLRQVLLDFGTPEDKMESLALLNGMRLNDQVAANTLLKVVEKGN